MVERCQLLRGCARLPPHQCRLLLVWFPRQDEQAVAIGRRQQSHRTEREAPGSTATSRPQDSRTRRVGAGIHFVAVRAGHDIVDPTQRRAGSANSLPWLSIVLAGVQSVVLSCIVCCQDQRPARASRTAPFVGRPLPIDVMVRPPSSLSKTPCS